MPKKDGTLRLCVDYRDLNRITVKNRYLLSLISEILDRLSGAERYSVINLRDVYYCIKVALKDCWKTAFYTRYNYFEYKVILFRLTNASAIFQVYINEVLTGLLDIIYIAYLNNIIIYSYNENQHADNVRKVLKRLW